MIPDGAAPLLSPRDVLIESGSRPNRHIYFIFWTQQDRILHTALDSGGSLHLNGVQLIGFREFTTMLFSYMKSKESHTGIVFGLYNYECNQFCLTLAWGGAMMEDKR